MPLMRVINAVLCELPDAVKAYHRINSNIDHIREEGIPDSDERIELAPEIISAQSTNDMERLSQVTKRADFTATGVTLALSIFFAGSGQVRDALTAVGVPDRLMDCIVYGFILATTLYFLTAGYCSLLVHRTNRLYFFSLADELHYADKREKTRRPLEILDLNREVIRKYTNLVDVSCNAVRNGLICTFIVIVLLTVGKFLPTAENKKPGARPKPETTHIDNRKIFINSSENR